MVLSTSIGDSLDLNDSFSSSLGVGCFLSFKNQLLLLTKTFRFQSFFELVPDIEMQVVVFGWVKVHGPSWKCFGKWVLRHLSFIG